MTMAAMYANAITVPEDDASERSQRAYPPYLRPVTISELSEPLAEAPRSLWAEAQAEQAAQAASEELLRYLSFEEGWDGYAAMPFRLQTIAKAQNIVQWSLWKLTQENVAPDEITPGPASDGSVDVELAALGRQLIFTIDGDNHSTVRVYANGEGTDVVREEILGAETVVGWLGWLVGAHGLPTQVERDRAGSGWGHSVALSLPA